MDRRAGSLVILIMAASAFVSSMSSGRQVSPPPADRETPETARATTANTSLKPATLALELQTVERGKCDPRCGIEELLDVVGSFYGQERGDIENLSVPAADLGKLQFVIATLPDPVHTHLALFFDRQIEAMIQGAQQAGYLFARSFLPWDRKEHPESSDWRVRSGGEAYDSDRASFPGLLIFRTNQPNNQDKAFKLFVFIVGETPTGGIERVQFSNALAAMQHMGWKPSSSGAATSSLRILGPTFSGSFYSFLECLNSEPALRDIQVDAHSGTVSSYDTVEWVSGLKPRGFHFTPLQESDTYIISRFVKYVQNQGYDKSQITLLSESESAYGNLQTAAGNALTGIRHLFFPRDISQIRSAYQRDLEKTADSIRNAPSSLLPLNLADTGVDDGVPVYSETQTPVSQDTLLRALVDKLDRYEAKFVIVSATNPLDELFLCRFLRTVFPKVRLVTIGADLLFVHEKDDTLLRGIFALTTYSLIPRVHEYLSYPASGMGPPDRSHVFPSYLSAGTFNAMLSLLTEQTNSRDMDGDGDDAEPAAEEDTGVLHTHLPVAAYTEYGWPNYAFTQDQIGAPPGARDLAPPIWLTVLGRDGYWPLALLEAPEYAVPHVSRHLPDIGPTPVRVPSPIYSFSRSSWLLITLLLGAAGAFCVFLWTGAPGSVFHLRRTFANVPLADRSYALGAVGTILLALLLCLNWPFVRFGNSFRPPWLGYLLLASAVAFVAVCVWNFVARGSRRAAWLFLLSAVIVVAIMAGLFRMHHEIEQRLMVLRLFRLESGVSPLLPCLLLAGAGLWWAYFNLAGLAHMDDRRPLLPSKPAGDDTMLPPILFEEEQCRLVNILQSAFKGNHCAIPGMAVGVLALIISPLLFEGLHHPLHTLEGKWYGWLYAALVLITLFTLTCEMFRMLLSWGILRELLQALERLPLRSVFEDLHGFSWRPLSRIGSDSYGELAHIWERVARLGAVLKTKHADKPSGDNDLNACERTRLVEIVRMFDMKSGPVQLASDRPSFAGQKTHLKSFKHMLSTVSAATAGLLVLLARRWEMGFWLHDVPFRPRSNQDETAGKAPGAKSENLPEEAQLAEQIVGMAYLRYIISVLLRIRTLSWTAAGMFVLILGSLISYPFEPRRMLLQAMIVLFVLSSGVIAFVFAQMHRNTTLSRITATTPGKLGIDFWIRIAGFVAVPLLSLLAAYIPELRSFLFSWLQPSLNAFK